jgi:hypothetical protein
MKKVLLYLENSFPDESHERALSVGPGLIEIKSAPQAKFQSLQWRKTKEKNQCDESTTHLHLAHAHACLILNTALLIFRTGDSVAACFKLVLAKIAGIGELKSSPEKS